MPHVYIHCICTHYTVVNWKVWYMHRCISAHQPNLDGKHGVSEIPWGKNKIHILVSVFRNVSVIKTSSTNGVQLTLCHCRDCHGILWGWRPSENPHQSLPSLTLLIRFYIHGFVLFYHRQWHMIKRIRGYEYHMGQYHMDVALFVVYSTTTLISIYFPLVSTISA